VVLQELIPKSIRSAILVNIERITQPITDFIRGNPIVSTAAIGIGTTGLIAGATTLVRRRKAKKAAKRKTKRKVSRRRVKRRKRVGRPKGKRKKVSHASPRHRGHKKVTFTTKTGQKVSFLVRKKMHAHRRKRRKS